MHRYGRWFGIVGLAAALLLLLFGAFAGSTTAVSPSHALIGGSGGSDEDVILRTTDKPLDVVLTVGAVDDACPSTTSAVVPVGESAHFCITVSNSGDRPFVQHEVAIPALDIAGTFAYTLAPSARLTIDSASLADFGVGGSLTLAEVGEPLTATLYYTAITAADGTEATVAVKSTAAVNPPEARVLVTGTIGADPAVCAPASLQGSVENGVPLYYCARLENVGGLPIEQHALELASLGEVIAFTRTLAAGETLEVTQALLDELGVGADLGQFTIPNNDKLKLMALLFYTGSGAVDGALSGGSQTYTTTATARLDMAPSTTPAPTITPEAADAATATATAAGASPLATPSPAQDAIATAEAQATLDVLYAAATAQAQSTQAAMEAQAASTAEPQSASPLAAPTTTAVAPQQESPLGEPTATATPTDQPASTPTQEPTVQPTVAMAETDVAPGGAPLIVLVTSTPVSANGLPPVPKDTLAQRPVILPTPVPTPDYLLEAAMAFDSMVQTVTWVWLLAGSMIFFVVAGVFAGLSFRSNEQARFRLSEPPPSSDLSWADDAFLMPPPLNSKELDDWPDSLP